ncbi:F-box domain-containing protein [Mycena kentingensis (nom. inval.)]|nr:F-box domain-containing protein [Mycena kentingensis (nom. inval.)]
MRAPRRPLPPAQAQTPLASEAVESTVASRSADRAQLAILTAESEALDATLLALRAQIDPIKRRLDSYIYPIATIPNEMLSEIFLCYVEDAGLYPGGPKFFFGNRPETLLLVCKAWRDIALTTPRLWRTLQFEVGWTVVEGQTFSGPSALIQAHVNVARKRLERSGVLPIAFRVPRYDEIGAVRRQEMPTQTSTLELLLQSAHRMRWEYAHLELDDQYCGPRIEGPFPYLRQLDITYRGDELHEENRSIDSILAPLNSGDAPNLRMLSACLTNNAWAVVSFPWSQLTRLHLGGDGVLPSAALTIIRQCAVLTECRLSILAIEHDSEPGVLPTTQLLTLQTLIINQSEVLWERTSPDLFVALRAPNLRRLYLDEVLFFIPGFTPGFAHAILADAIRRMTGDLRLERLGIGRVTQAEGDYRQALGTIPELEFHDGEMEEDEDEYDAWGSWQSYLCER